MAVEARHLNLFHPQIIGNRGILDRNAAIEGGNTNIDYNAPIGLYSFPPVITDSIQLPKTTSIKSESDLTSYYNPPISRKRSRDDSIIINPMLSYSSDFHHNLNNQINNRCASISFLGEDLSLQIQQQQFEIDRFISQHIEKVRIEIEEKRKRYSRRIIAAMEEGIMKKLKAKEEQVQNIGKLNWELEEKVKSLCLENQIWRDLAQSSEATANALRSNLEQVLAHIKDHHHHHHHYSACLEEAAGEDLINDAQSCCGSNFDDDGGGGGGEEEDEDEEERRMLAGEGGERKWVKDKSSVDNHDSMRWCRSCGKEESCVLLLPCRHLCLCAVCGCTVHTCPICKSNKDASVHVNMC